MRIVDEKNLAFADQPKPLEVKEVAENFKPREPRKRLTQAEMDLSLLIPALDQPEVELAKDGACRQEQGYELQVKVRNFQVGAHVYPLGTTAIGLETLGNKSDNFDQALESTGYVPDHLALHPVPDELPESLRVRPFIQAKMAQQLAQYGDQATTVFNPEDRMVFNDTSYPWGACGRIDTPLGFASGVMVGPRHVLTCSHVIQWNSNNTTGWIRFRPGFFNGSAPFGDAWGTLTYYKYKVTGPTINWIEGMYDYVVVVLNRNIGNWTGWMGSRGYTDSWDGGNYWAHIGYPGDLTGGNRPTFENNISLDGVWWQFDSHESMAHRGDVWPGQSGGPFFGWWSGDVGPRVVAVQSSHNSSQNNASGGQDMVDLVIRARNEHP